MKQKTIAILKDFLQLFVVCLVVLAVVAVGGLTQRAINDRKCECGPAVATTGVVLAYHPASFLRVDAVTIDIGGYGRLYTSQLACYLVPGDTVDCILYHSQCQYKKWIINFRGDGPCQR